MKKWIIRTFGLKGSWSWAKKQMMKGKMVRCKHWTGTLKYRVSPEIQKVEKKHPYKQRGNPETYREYNEGWSDACDILGNEILTHLKQSKG